MSVARTRTAIAGVCLAVTAGVLGACSSPANDAETTATVTASASSEPTAPVGSDPGTWTPLQLDASASIAPVEMVVGQVGIVWDNTWPDPSEVGGVTISSSDESVVSVSQAEGGEGGFSASPSIVAVAPGDAEITLHTGKMMEGELDATDVLIVFQVHVTE